MICPDVCIHTHMIGIRKGIEIEGDISPQYSGNIDQKITSDELVASQEPSHRTLAA